jgi:hypothetical protein
VPCLDMALGYSISLEKSGSHDDLFIMHVGYVGYEKRRLRQLRHVHMYVSRDTFFSGCISLPSSLLVTVSPPSAPCSRESRGILTQFYTQMSP